MALKIAVMARGLTSTPTGRGLMARLIVEELIEIRPKWRLLVFSAVHPGLRQVDWHRATGRSAWQGLFLWFGGAGRAALKYEADIFWAATHLLPAGLPQQLPKVIMLHDAVWRDHPETMSRSNRIAARAGESGMRKADIILCNSRFTRSRLAEYWPDLLDRVVLMPLAGNTSYRTDIDPWPVLQTYGITRPYVLNVDTVEPRKNLEVLLDCAEALPEVSFIQCGGIGWKVESLMRRAEHIPNVRFLGYLDDKDVNALYLGASAAVFPSIYEGFHISLLDAAKLGCPVVASDIPVHREVLDDAACYVEPSDTSSFVAALSRLLTDPTYAGRLSTAGRERSDRFSWEQTAEIFAATAESLLN